MLRVLSRAAGTAAARSGRAAFASTTRPLLAAAGGKGGRRRGAGQGGSATGGGEGRQGEIVVVTSGKGGVGKTTTAASLAYGLALEGKRTVAIDFDIGLRNLDLHLGCERRVIFDFVNVLNGECTVRQALIKDKKNEELFMLAASQTKDKTALKTDAIERLMEELRRDFDYIVCDSPAGIESGALHAMYFADRAVICCNPEISSARDCDKMIGLISSKSKRALDGAAPVEQHLLVLRYDANKVESGSMMPVADVADHIGIPLLGVVPESDEVIRSSNVGKPVITSDGNAGEAYRDVVQRFLGNDVPLRFTTPTSGFFGRLFG